MLLFILTFALILYNDRIATPAHVFSSSPLASVTPTAILKEADRLSWLGNWYAAGPLYSNAEVRFCQARDHHNEIRARLGRIRSQASYLLLDQTFAAIGRELNRSEVVRDPKLRMWALALLASSRIDSDSHKSKQEWMATLKIAEKQGEYEWAARAKGELGIIAFLEGNTAEAVNLLGGAIFSAYRTQLRVIMNKVSSFGTAAVANSCFVTWPFSR